MHNLKLILQRKALLVLMVPTITLCFAYKFLLPVDNYNYDHVYATTNTNFIIYNTKCRIPNTDPFNSEVKRFYKKNDYVSCRKLELLTYVTKNKENTEAVLHINKTLIPSYSKKGITCCYSNITRAKKNIDNEINLSSCKDFKSNVTMAEHAVLVRCQNLKTKAEVYNNVHYAVTIQDQIKPKLGTFDKSACPLSVLFIGVDSISRLNMMRDMPLTHDYLNNHEWIELQAYNKMGDNTFPNLMAILTGKNETAAYAKCDPTVEKALDTCNLIWYEFAKHNYVTGYAEDTASISSFNYHKKGFHDEPVDYYFRPLMVAAEKKLKTQVVDEMVYCAGPETSGERILNVAKDFAITFKDTPSFGLFWMNSFSHNKLNAPTRMDAKLKEFLETLKSEGVLENSAVIFISDHGLRFGEIVRTYTGWLEERLPMFYIWIPEKFREIYASEYENLQINSNRLTNPYDLHMTLQDILLYSGVNYTVKPSEGCPKCKSLLKEIEFERSCEDASIDWHWCACPNYKIVGNKSDTVQKAANFIASSLNDKLNSKGLANKCAKYTVNEVISSRISDTSAGWYKNDTYLLIVLKTVPFAIFEATVKVQQLNATDVFRLEEGVSRLDSYSAHSRCIDNSYWKTICYCK